jgi:hypothetical protein
MPIGTPKLFLCTIISNNTFDFILADYSFTTLGRNPHSGCRGSAGWQLAGNYIQTSHQHAPGAYLLLSLDVPGFRNKGEILGGRRLEAGSISFTFELRCKGKCEFVFMQVR